jgi:dTDP-4-dehydrorhamnose reductase
LAGERAVQLAGCAYLVLRTSWVYSLRRGSFVSKVLEWARSQERMRLVVDQVGSPTWARPLAEMTSLLIAKAGHNPVGWLDDRKGVYHLAGSGACSRKEWGEAVLRYDPHRSEQIVQEILPALSADFPAPAPRPVFSALDCRRFNDVFGLALPEWDAALQMALEP